MIHEFQLRALPEQAYNEQAVRRFVAREKGLDERTIQGVRILKKALTPVSAPSTST